MSEIASMPMNETAEWSVLAHLFARPELIGEVIGTKLEVRDFTSEASRAVYRTVVDRFYRSGSVDAIVVAELLRDELAQAWGMADNGDVPAALHAKLASARTGSDVLGQAEVVRQLSAKRQLQQVCFDALLNINAGGMTVEEVGDTLSTGALQITSGGIKRSELMDWMSVGREYVVALKRNMLARQQGLEIGVYTGYKFVDDYTVGLQPGELCFLAGDPGAGKLLSLSTPLPTPTGWTTMGEVQSGDMICDERGRATRVTGVSPVEYGANVYELRFSDGATVKASGTHTWVVSSRRARHRVTGQAHRHRTGKRNRPPDPLELEELTTEEIAANVRVGWDGRANYAVQIAGPLKGRHRSLPLDPYILGCWLAEGSTNAAVLSLGDAEIVDVLRDRGASVKVRDESRPGGGTRLAVSLSKPTGVRALRAAGVLGYKHIPPTYLRASEEQRWALLAGIADGDGWCDHGGCEITTVLPRLRDDIYELATSLGCAVYVNEGRAVLDGVDYGPKWNLRFQSARCPFAIERKARGWTPRRLDCRYIVAVEPVPSEPVKCLAVEAKSHLYLCGQAMIPTHNSAVAWRCAEGFAVRQLQRPVEKRVSTLVLSMEMNLYGSTQRLVQAITGIDGRLLREAAIDERQYKHILREWKNREHMPLIWNFASNFRLSQMRALIAEAIRKHNVGFVVIDHFRMIDTDRRYQNGNEADEAKVRFLKEDVCKDLNVTVMCLAHSVKIGRQAAEEGSRPRLSDLRGSGQVAAHADHVAFLYRPGKHLTDAARMEMNIATTDAELIWAKNRWGDEKTALLKFEPETMRIAERFA